MEYPPTKWTPWGKVRWGLYTSLWLSISLAAWTLYFTDTYTAPYGGLILTLSGYAGSFMLLPLWCLRKWL